jgi:hypothetical protein
MISRELKSHAPFTALGTVSGIVLLILLLWARVPRDVSVTLFWTLHPLHVLLSALVTTAMFRLHGGRGIWRILGVGYLGSVGIATLSDCLIPYAGEWLLALPQRGLHLGFIEKWWLVNPLALGGIAIGYAWPHTKFPHAGHVLLSTWASLFHVTMALGTELRLIEGVLIALFLFLSVWLPCCTSDIVFPLIFAPKPDGGERSGQRHWYRITGLPGWKRKQLRMPAFGEGGCASPRPEKTPSKARDFSRRHRRQRDPNANDQPKSPGENSV